MFNCRLLKLKRTEMFSAFQKRAVTDGDTDDVKA